jgi:hypothetical protein
MGKHRVYDAGILLGIVLAAILALLLAYVIVKSGLYSRSVGGGSSGRSIKGGGDSGGLVVKPHLPVPPHIATDTARRFKDAVNGHQKILVPVDPNGHRNPNAIHGGKDKEKKELPPLSWMKHKTWDSLLTSSDELYDQYFNDKSLALTRLPSDWSEVRKAAKPMVNSDREWAGIIDIVDGVPKVTFKYPSDTKAQENEAKVDLTKAQERTGYYVFHTHPAGYSNLISSADAVIAASCSFYGRYACNVVMCDESITLYGLTIPTINLLHKNPHPHLALAKYQLDIYNVISSVRSRSEYFSVREYNDLIRSMGMFIWVFPSDRYTSWANTRVYQHSTHTDFQELMCLVDKVAELQHEAYPDEPVYKPGSQPESPTIGPIG